jgi:hypothetical protein
MAHNCSSMQKHLLCMRERRASNPCQSEMCQWQAQRHGAGSPLWLMMSPTNHIKIAFQYAMLTVFQYAMLTVFFQEFYVIILGPIAYHSTRQGHLLYLGQ